MALTGETCAKAARRRQNGRTDAGSSALDEISPADGLLALKVSIFPITVFGHCVYLPLKSHRVKQQVTTTVALQRERNFRCAPRNGLTDSAGISSMGS